MSKRERFKLSLSVFLLLIKNHQVLLIKRSNTGWMDGFYSVPAGAIDGNEPLADAMVREAKEEVNINVSKTDLTLVHISHNNTDNQEWIGTYFLATKWTGEERLSEPEKHSEIKWASLTDLPENTVPYVKIAIESYLKKLPYSEFGWKE